MHLGDEHADQSCITFLRPAYAMLAVFLAGAVVALLLIRDLDNPFQSDGSSSVDVDLSLLDTTRSRLLGRAS